MLDCVEGVAAVAGFNNVEEDECKEEEEVDDEDGLGGGLGLRFEGDEAVVVAVVVVVVMMVEDAVLRFFLGDVEFMTLSIELKISMFGLLLLLLDAVV
jgi:hypothetical protein